MIGRCQPPVYSPLTWQAVAAALSGDDATRRVEEWLCTRFGARTALLTDSGTSALALAVAGARERRPGPVALPAYACFDVATAADAAQAPVVLYDLDPATLAPDLPSFRAALAAGAGTAVVVHLYGMPLPWAELAAEAEQAGALVIEDAAQGAGAALGGRPLGGFGPLSVLSFGRGKGLTAGAGGALLGMTDEARTIVAAAQSRLAPPRGSASGLAKLAAQWLLARPTLYGVPSALPFLGLGETTYRPPHPPRRPPGSVSRVLEATWDLQDREVAVRRRNASRLAARLGDKLRPVTPVTGANPGYLRLPVVAAAAAGAAALAGPARRLGVMPGYPMALSDLPGFGERRVNRDVNFPGSRDLARGLLTLPTHSLLREADLCGIESWLAMHVSQGGGS